MHINESAPRFLRRLRRALQSTENIRTVLASKIKLWDLAHEETSTSPFLHGFTPPLYVFGLEDSEARTLILQSQLPEGSRPELEETVIETIRHHCNNHPYLLQLLCERYQELSDLDRAIEEIATDQMVRHFFAVDFEMLMENERNIVRVIGEEGEATLDFIATSLEVEASSLSGDLTRLEHLGFIQRQESGSYSLVNFFFKRWFRELPSVQRAHRSEAGVLHPTVEEPANGQSLRTIDDRFELLERIGAGAAGEVYRAHDTLLNSEIALKLLKREYCEEEAASVRLRREVLLSRDLSHPNILKIYHLGDDDGQKYVTMQFVNGPDLARVISREAPFMPERAVRMMTKLASALAVAHAGNVIHRDIKPSNIIIDEHGEPHITDFGLARLLDGPEITRTGSFVGTPVYASPEQVKGEKLDERSDLYSLGIVAFELLTGRRPFEGDYLKEVAEKQLDEAPPVPCELRRGISRELSDLVLRCLEKDPLRRFQSAEELREALSGVTS